MALLTPVSKAGIRDPDATICALVNQEPQERTRDLEEIGRRHFCRTSSTRMLVSGRSRHAPISNHGRATHLTGLVKEIHQVPLWSNEFQPLSKVRRRQASSIHVQQVLNLLVQQSPCTPEFGRPGLPEPAPTQVGRTSRPVTFQSTLFYALTCSPHLSESVETRLAHQHRFVSFGPCNVGPSLGIDPHRADELRTVAALNVAMPAE